MASDTIFLECCFMKHAEDLVLSFLFEVSRNDSIYNVQEAIWNARPEVVEGRCDPAELVLYKLRPPEHPPTPSDYRKRQEAALSEHTHKLDGTSRVSDCFAEYDPDLLVPILIGGNIRPKRKRSRGDSDPGEHIDVKRLKVTEDHILAVKRGVLAREPSSAAQYVHLSSEQHKGPIKNGRPADQSGLPLAIYHPVFAKFKDLSADQNIRPSAREYALAHQLFAVAASIYDDEDARFNGMQPTLEGLLNDAFDLETRVCNIRNTRCLLTETRSPGFALRAVVEVKNEIGTGLCDPSIEGGMYYRKYWVQPSMEPVLNACCCPSFVISIAGPWICVLGAAFVDHVIVQPLTEYISLGGEPDYERRVSAVARIFHVLSGCMHDLNMFYGPLEVSDTLISSRLFPCFTCYSSGGTEVRLVYEYALLGKAVFLALTQHGEAVVVKFTESYCKAAHLLLAEHGLAPPLRYCEYFGGDLHVVVMDFLPGPDLALAKATRTTMLHIPVRARADVKEAVRLLHENGYVFGDLRAPNVVLHVRETDTESGDGRTEVEGAMLVDFDWCGTEPDARYPVVLNDTGDIEWPPGVERGGIICKEHDEWFLNELLCY